MTQKEKQPTGTAITDAEVEERIREFFARNYDLLRQEGGHALAEGAKRQALEQSLLYWRKLKAVATSVTETEVKLALPGLTTPKGRPFVLEGVVDIVREGDEVRMYDLKTHEENDVRAEREVYEDQLNVYAHIWKGIRGQILDGTAIIATRLPLHLREALRTSNSNSINTAMASWNPVVDLPFDENEVARTIEDFGRCVDAIEDGEFAAPSPKMLGRSRGTRRRKGNVDALNSRADRELTFAQIHCRSCDGRFSCASYVEHIRNEARPSAHVAASSNGASDNELDEWIEANLGNED